MAECYGLLRENRYLFQLHLVQSSDCLVTSTCTSRRATSTTPNMVRQPISSRHDVFIRSTLLIVSNTFIIELGKFRVLHTAAISSLVLATISRGSQSLNSRLKLWYLHLHAVRAELLAPSAGCRFAVLNGTWPLSMLATQGKYDEADPLYQRTIEIKEKALGLDHPDLATSLGNLATSFTTQVRKLGCCRAACS